VINGAICMELLSPDGWNPINSVESVIVSIQSHLVIGRGRLAAAKELGDQKRNLLLKKLIYDEEDGGGHDNEASTSNGSPCKRKSGEMALDKENNSQVLDAGEYSVAEAKLYFKRNVSSHERTGWSNGSVERG
jgi:ubiquitin-conjugating enzyme E2 Q